MNQPDPLNQPESFAELEQQLTRGLRPVAPPEGFADRTIARLQPAAPARAKVVTMRPRLWASGAIAATLLAGVFVADETHVRHQRQKAELAQQQFDAAIRITDQTLDHVRQQLQQAGDPVGN